MGATAGAVAGVVQAGAGLLGGGGGGGTQYVPNYSAMNEVQLASIDFLSRNYDAQKQLSEASFQNTLGMQEADYKRLLTQLVYDQEFQKQQLLSQAYQSQAATNVAETTLAMQRLQQVYDRETNKLVSQLEYENLIEKQDLDKQILNMTREATDEGSRIRQRDVAARRQELLADYGLTKEQLAAQMMQADTEMQQAATQTSQQVTAAELAGSSAETAASLQRRELMSQFIENARKQELSNAQQVAAAGSRGLVDTDRLGATLALSQELDPIMQLKRTLGMDDINTQEALASNQALTQKENALRMGEYAQQMGEYNRGRIRRAGEEADLSFAAGNRALGTEEASLMNSVYLDAIQNGVAPMVADLLAREQAEQRLQLAQRGIDVQSLGEDYAYDVARAGIDYGRSQDAQALNDYLRMIESQGNLNLQSAEAQYITGLASGYAQNAAQQSQLASGASAGINNAASQIRGATMVNQPGSSGFNWGGLGNLAQAGVGLFSSLSGGGGNNYSTVANTQLSPYTNTGYTDPSVGYSGFSGYRLPG